MDTGGTEWRCFREDGENLVQKWLEEKKSLKSNAKYVRNNKELQMLDINETDHLLGLFGQHHLRFGDSRVPEEDPTVEDMTMKAIEVDYNSTLEYRIHAIMNLIKGDVPYYHIALHMNIKYLGSSKI